MLFLRGVCMCPMSSMSMPRNGTRPKPNDTQLVYTIFNFWILNFFAEIHLSVLSIDAHWLHYCRYSIIIMRINNNRHVLFVLLFRACSCRVVVVRITRAFDSLLVIHEMNKQCKKINVMILSTWLFLPLCSARSDGPFTALTRCTQFFAQ